MCETTLRGNYDYELRTTNTTTTTTTKSTNDIRFRVTTTFPCRCTSSHATHASLHGIFRFPECAALTRSCQPIRFVRSLWTGSCENARLVESFLLPLRTNDKELALPLVLTFPHTIDRIIFGWSLCLLVDTELPIEWRATIDNFEFAIVIVLEFLRETDYSSARITFPLHIAISSISMSQIRVFAFFFFPLFIYFLFFFFAITARGRNEAPSHSRRTSFAEY